MGSKGDDSGGRVLLLRVDATRTSIFPGGKGLNAKKKKEIHLKCFELKSDLETILLKVKAKLNLSLQTSFQHFLELYHLPAQVFIQQFYVSFGSKHM